MQYLWRYYNCLVRACSEGVNGTPLFIVSVGEGRRKPLRVSELTFANAIAAALQLSPAVRGGPLRTGHGHRRPRLPLQEGK